MEFADEWQVMTVVLMTLSKEFLWFLTSTCNVFDTLKSGSKFESWAALLILILLI